MAWYDEAVFYHIYPLGLSGAPELNDYSKPVSRLSDLRPWIDHMKAAGFTALYLGPCFSSGSHGYDTTDYRRVDERLGDNRDLKDFVRYCHDNDIHVIIDPETGKYPDAPMNPEGLGGATNGIPDLTSPGIELGTSVDLEWQEGLELSPEI